MSNFFRQFISRFREESIPSEEKLILTYSEMSDVALKRLEPGQLTPMARKCYDAEVGRRSGHSRQMK